MTKRILSCGAGGAPALNFIRSLRKAKEKFYITGITCNKYDLIKAKRHVSKVFLVPPAKDKNYISVLQQIIKEEKSNFLHAQNDEEVVVISRNRNKLGVKTYLPSHEVVELCQDKFKSAQIWSKSGLNVPETYLINN